MRTDLPSMSTGRAAAQASHASNAFIHKFGNRDDVRSWTTQTKQGFGTAIVLSATEKDINNIMDLDWLVKDTVIDPDYVIVISSEIVDYIGSKFKSQLEPLVKDTTKFLFHREEITCAYIFGKKEELKPYLEKFNLYP